jgi:hypothetical protein
MPVSVSLSEDNERLKLIKYSGLSVLPWEAMNSWFSFVSDVLKHEKCKLIMGYSLYSLNDSAREGILVAR